ncbi:MAG: hypothetical protein K8S98_00420 [Planctomycetes bacterium]|nr:hypothetical protein [Planctomycetota bacterium]
MISNARLTRGLIPFVLSAVSTTALLLSACDAQAGAPANAEHSATLRGPIEDAALAPYQSELLDLAFDTASALPVQPHIKNRSRAQDAVVATCLELEQPHRALAFVERIDNWRRGAGYADLAFYCAQHGDVVDAKSFSELALALSSNTDEGGDGTVEDWQRDRIRMKVARTAARLGDDAHANELQAGLGTSESGKVASAKALVLDDAAFDAALAALDPAIASGGFDQVRNALETCAQLYDRFYAQTTRRELARTKIESSWTHLPIGIRIELLVELCESALAHDDSVEALGLARAAVRIMDGSKWKPEDHIAVQTELARLLHRSGDRDGAREQLAIALARFDAERNQIVNIYRAGALRALAEAQQSLGDTALALATYKRALEAGVENPNSRPRAEDLAATCSSLAANRVEPDADLRARLLEIRRALGDPW